MCIAAISVTEPVPFDDGAALPTTDARGSNSSENSKKLAGTSVVREFMDASQDG
jgi:hypothetical protein